MSAPTSVLVVVADLDYRTLLRVVINEQEELKVVGEATSGEEALEQVARLRPQVVLMELALPGAGGLEAARQIMAAQPTPILLFTAAEVVRERLEACLDAGALDLIERPGAAELQANPRRLRERLCRLARIPVISPPGPARRRKRTRTPGKSFLQRAGRLVAIVASTGGPQALTRILRDLPADLPAAVVVVQHIDAGFEQGLLRSLGEVSPLQVCMAEHEQDLLEGCVYLAPQGRFLEITVRRRIALVAPGSPVTHCPSGDRLFESAADAYGHRAIGVVLTGIGRDGAAGLQALRRAEAVTIAQDEASSVIFGMPQEAIKNGSARYVLRIDQIAPAIAQALR